MVNRQRAISSFLEYARIDSESGNEREMMQRVIRDLEALGLSAQTDNAGQSCGSNANNIYGSLEGTLPLEPLLLCAHMDTVKPGNGVKPVVDGDYIRSEGDTVLGGDDKSGINVILEALRVIVENKLPHRPIEFVFTICEENGLLGAKNLEYHRIRSKNAIVLDSRGHAGDIKIKSPGLNRLKFRVRGKAAHAGACPEDGVSAIMVASEAIANMRLLRIDETTTANIGCFLAEGETNIVCPNAYVEAETRSFDLESLNRQTEHMVNCFVAAAQKYGAELEHEVFALCEPFDFPKDHEMVRLISEKARKHGLDAVTFFDGGGSDANVLAKNGIATFQIGNGMDKVHTTSEELYIPEYIRTIQVLLSILTEA